jgi:peptidoglycan-associated lipoprotein
VLDRKADILRANPALRIRISGHADERGSDEYNLVLGNKRSLAAKQYLVSKGVDASRIDVTSFGEERPVDPASNEAAWAKNRRDEFEIIGGGDKLVAPR